MKPIPVTSSDFPQIRSDGQTYVDKTAWLHRLVTDPEQRFFFLSRPRRFGKSLMISTLKAIFHGRRELFDGLAISRMDYDWKPHPVIHLNMGMCSRPEVAAFERSLAVQMESALSACGCTYDRTRDPADNLGCAIDSIAAGGSAAVLLIDEYDDPVAQVIDDPAKAEAIRKLLAALYRQLKERTGMVRFLMIAGVSKFTKMSIFSALSNLRDISLEDDFASMLGFTEGELTGYYSEHMADHAEKMGVGMEAYRAELKRMYNGYRFWKFAGEDVYNPVSINLNMASRRPVFQCYWSDTGRPSMLMNFLKREDILAIEPERVTGAVESDFDVVELSAISLKGLLYQTGYLTIRDYNPYSQVFTLGIPDEEVRKDFALVMASACAKRPVAWAASLGAMLFTEDWEHFFAGLKSLYAGVAYGPKEARVCEFSYGRCLQFLLQGQGIVCRPEVVQADGRADMVCEHHCGVYIFELKMDAPAAIAMEQMKRREYALPYAADLRPIWLIGLSFDSRTRQLVDCAQEKYR